MQCRLTLLQIGILQGQAAQLAIISLSVQGRPQLPESLKGDL